MDKCSSDKIIEEIKAYIQSTYNEHYVNNNGSNLLNYIGELGDLESFSRASALKYIVRYGKKAGYNKIDIYKAIHYLIILLNCTINEEHKCVKDNFEYDR